MRRRPLDEITTLRLGTTVRLGLCTCTSEFTSSSYNVLRVEDARKLSTIDGRDKRVRRVWRALNARERSGDATSGDERRSDGEASPAAASPSARVRLGQRALGEDRAAGLPTYQFLRSSTVRKTPPPRRRPTSHLHPPKVGRCILPVRQPGIGRSREMCMHVLAFANAGINGGEELGYLLLVVNQNWSFTRIRYISCETGPDARTHAA